MTAWRVALVAALWLIAIGISDLGTSDTDLRLRMAHSWWTSEPQVDPDLRPPTSRYVIEHGMVGIDGARHIFYDPGQSILMLPADWVGTRVQGWVHAATAGRLRILTVVWLTFFPLNILMMVACYWLLRLFGTGAQLAGVGSITWLLGTTALPYAQVAFQNNQVLLFVIIAHASILAWIDTRSRWFLLASGLAAGACVLMRASGVVHVLTIGLFLVGCLTLDRRGWRESTADVALWVAGLMPVVMAGRVFDFERWGSLWTTGQEVWLKQINTDPLFAGMPQFPPNFPFVHSLWTAVSNLLCSSGKSLLLYDPLFLPCVGVGILCWRSFTPFVRLFIGTASLNLILHVTLFGRLDFWHGDAAWGARYHVTSVDLLLIPLVPVLVKSALSAISSRAWLARGALAVGILVQLLAVSMPYGEEIGVEALKDYSICDHSSWTTQMGFRLGNRVKNLYCLASDSQSPQCPLMIAARAAREHPTCHVVVRDLTHSTRVSFFPFDPQNRALVSRVELAVWALSLIAASVLTVAWLRSLRDVLRLGETDVTGRGEQIESRGEEI